MVAVLASGDLAEPMALSSDGTLLAMPAWNCHEVLPVPRRERSLIRNLDGPNLQ